MIRHWTLPTKHHGLEFQTALVGLLTSVGTLGLVAEVRSQDLASDKAALEALYNATGGCAPTSSTFQNRLETVPNKSAPNCSADRYSIPGKTSLTGPKVRPARDELIARVASGEIEAEDAVAARVRTGVLARAGARLLRRGGTGVTLWSRR